MYIWNIFKALTYLLFCYKKYVYSHPPSGPQTIDLIPAELNLNNKISTNFCQCVKKGNDVVYTVKDGYGFSALTFGTPVKSQEQILWITKDPREYCDKVEKLGQNKIIIHQINGKSKVYLKAGSGSFGTNIKWAEVKTSYMGIKQVEEKVEPEPETKNYATDDVAELPSPSVDYTVYRPPDPKFHSNTARICLDLTIKSSTAYFQYIKNGGIERYIPNKGHVFSSVKAGYTGSTLENILWNARNNIEYARRVIVNWIANSEMITIDLFNGEKVKFYTDEDHPWVRVDPDKWTPVTIDIKSVSKYFLYNYYGNKVVSYYEAKNNFLFEGVNHDRVRVWRADSPNEFAYKVFVQRVHLESISVRILMINGRSRTFYKPSAEYPWCDGLESRCPYTPPKKTYWDSRDYPKDTIEVKHNLNYMAFGINKMTEISNYILREPVEEVDSRHYNGIGGFGLKFVDILMWNNSSYSRLAAKIPLLNRPFYVLVHRKNRWNSGFCKNVRSLKDKLTHIQAH